MTTQNRSFLVLLLQFAVVMSSACSAIEAPDAGGPRAPGPAYPIRLADNQQREEAALSVWRQLAQQLGISDEATVELHPITATIIGFSPSVALYLPRVGDGPEMTDDEQAESLRRFISGWQRLIGAEPAHLSLVDWQDLPDGTRAAHYEQRPFRHPLRGEFGKLRIQFGPDRRVLQLSSTCVPEAERIQNQISAIEPQISREDVTALLRNKGVSYTDQEGRLHTYTLPQEAEPDAELVVYARSAPDPNGLLEFRVAWEIELAGAPVKIVYMDSVNGEMWHGHPGQ